MRGGKRNGAGRPAGMRNQKTLAIDELMSDIGCNPAIALAQIATQAVKNGEIDLAVDCYKSLLPYVYPKLRDFDADSKTTKPIMFNLITGVPPRKPKPELDVQ